MWRSFGQTGEIIYKKVSKYIKLMFPCFTVVASLAVFSLLRHRRFKIGIEKAVTYAMYKTVL